MMKSSNFKPTVQVEKHKSKITKNAVRLPKSLLDNTSEKNLKRLLIIKGRAKK